MQALQQLHEVFVQQQQQIQELQKQIRRMSKARPVVIPESPSVKVVDVAKDTFDRTYEKAMYELQNHPFTDFPITMSSWSKVSVAAYRRLGLDAAGAIFSPALEDLLVDFNIMPTGTQLYSTSYTQRLEKIRMFLRDNPKLTSVFVYANCAYRYAMNHKLLKQVKIPNSGVFIYLIQLASMWKDPAKTMKLIDDIINCEAYGSTVRQEFIKTSVDWMLNERTHGGTFSKRTQVMGYYFQEHRRMQALTAALARGTKYRAGDSLTLEELKHNIHTGG